jgi:hypothetical protein
VGCAQLLARVASAALAAQPFAVQEMTAGELDVDAGAGEPLDRLAIERLGGFPVAEQRLRAGLDAERPVGATGPGCLRKLAEGIDSELRLAAPNGGLDQLDPAIIAPPRWVSVLAGPLRRGERVLVTAQTVTEHSRHPVNECQPLSLAPTHDLPRGGLDELEGLGFPALEGRPCERGPRCEAATRRVVDRRHLVEQRRGHGELAREHVHPGA